MTYKCDDSTRAIIFEIILNIEMSPEMIGSFLTLLKKVNAKDLNPSSLIFIGKLVKADDGIHLEEIIDFFWLTAIDNSGILNQDSISVALSQLAANIGKVVTSSREKVLFKCVGIHSYLFIIPSFLVYLQI